MKKKKKKTRSRNKGGITVCDTFGDKRAFNAMKSTVRVGTYIVGSADARERKKKYK